MILEGIIANKRAEVAVLREQYANWRPPGQLPPRRAFAAALRRPGISLIAEFKRRSPSRGVIRAEADPASVAQRYEEAGAAAISVLTDERFFGGSLDDLHGARESVALPVLRKDFIVDPVQIAESAGASGPDAVLLIAAVFRAGDELLPYDLREMRELVEACGQAALVEVHDEADVDLALESGAQVIGINNRDLRTFEVSLETTIRLRPRIPAGVLVVSESGVRSRDDVRRLEQAGVDAILVGEVLMAADDPGAKIGELIGA